MTEAFLENYFKGIAAASVDIAHTDDLPSFYKMSDSNDLDEWDEAVRNITKPVCLILETGSGSIGEWDSQRDSPRIGLHCLVKTTEKTSDINGARDFAKLVLQKIVSRMRLDCKTAFERPDQTIGPLRAVNVVFDSNIKFSNMTGIDGNWYGKSFYFDFRVPLNLVYNPDDWTA